MIVVMPNTRACAKFDPSPIGTDDKCTQEYVKDIIPYVDWRRYLYQAAQITFPDCPAK